MSGKIEELAAKYGIELAAVKAVIEIESGGKPSAFLFEPKVFSRLTGGKYDSSHPNVSSKVWNKALYKTNAANYKEACSLDEKAAKCATSFGIFQILGYHFATCGYKDVDSFVKDLQGDEDTQAEIFFKFLSSAMLKALKEKDFATFAKLYNGAGYKRNAYDTKLQASYQKFSKQF